ncbi:MAG: PDZ domain-containing protein [Limimaricola sp.]|uniref:trypsin-like peptidase domain-containing protein n=1 Tax=Limimaricola sp. TaxID=2211665 RepID=UPI001D31EEC1|nr:trypsin-like peptidase domain-containing protein [Limimaricola sp.]MBI1416565.1 PDZ domain-containing protein [Limimaricola sp.]
MHRFAIALVPLLLATAALAEPQVPLSRAEVQMSLSPVVRAATPAVVNIYATRVVAQRQSPFANDPIFSQFFGGGLAAPRVQNSLGSGVILRSDGIVVSNYHVVGDATDIRVVLADRREFAGKVLLADKAADLAVIKLDGAKGLPALTLADSDLAQVGDFVIAIGNPFGIGQTVTSGIVSGLARSGASDSSQGYYVQTDAAINPGNSGGALVDLNGHLLGINTSILSQSGGSNGIGFAIPADLVARYVAAAEAGQKSVVHPWSGLDAQTVDATMADALGLSPPHGVVINRLHPQSPFSKAGLATGDVIVSVAGQPVNAPSELAYRLAVTGAGNSADVSYWRAGALHDAQVQLGAAPGSDASPVAINGGTVLDGLSVQQVSPAVIDALGLPLDATGLAVTDVQGPVLRTGLQPGDLLLSVNGRSLQTPDDLKAVLRSGGRSWQIEVQRGTQRAMIRLRGY